jgi:hypothetical protein
MSKTSCRIGSMNQCAAESEPLSQMTTKYNWSTRRIKRTSSEEGS